ncbi:MAG: hypothetical protein ACQEXX_11220 [Bacillota bacterium]
MKQRRGRIDSGEAAAVAFVPEFQPCFMISGNSGARAIVGTNSYS